MAFEKNHPKKGGRKAGTPNKATAAHRETLEQFVCEELTVNELKDLYKSLKPVEKAAFIPKVWAFIMPKMQHLEMTGDVSLEQAQAVIDLIASKYGTVEE